jgi:NADH-quinone oxidoreductase subunit L
MFRSDLLVWCIPLFPLAGALLSALMGGGRLKKLSHVPCVIGAAMSFVVVLLILLSFSPDSTMLRSGGKWFTIGSASDANSMTVEASLVFDPLAAIMLLGITFIGTWIAVFSIGYMHGDPGYPRYFSIVGLFLFSMTLLVLADNFLFLFAGWEGVGLCSYLLIGYWHAKPSAAAAARKAFLVTRLGDVGLILGIFLLWSIGHTFDFDMLHARMTEKDNDTLVVACILILCGAIGKSAQFPLYVWLPDAMEGPTPVSALIHAATMVTAGVYLLARTMPLFVLCPGVQVAVSCIGAFTAILAAIIALTQNDLKRVLAYSTVSQIGYMFLALGTGIAGKPLALFAVTAAIFHLFTHAFFKAVLFLSAGSVMHGMGNVIDMRKFSGLRRVMPITHITFLCGAAALAGLPLLSGFWSKDAILEAVEEAANQNAVYGKIYRALFVVGVVTAALTAFYTFRAYFRTFWGETKIPPEAGEHAHESPSVMTVPLMVLALGAVFVGIVAEPFTHWFSTFLDRTTSLLSASGKKVPEHNLDWPIMIGGSIAALSGTILAWWMYCVRTMLPATLARTLPSWYRASLNLLYVDQIYNILFVQPLRFLAFVTRGTEALLYDLVRSIAAIPRGIAFAIRPLQNGLVQFYALTTAVGVAAFLGYLVFFTK